MYKLNSIGSYPKQKGQFALSDNSNIPFTLEYKANQLGWFFGFEYNGNTYQNIRLTTSYNILRAYRNWLPFGLMVQTNDGLEPMNVTDFSSGYASIYILNRDDVDTVEGNFYVKV